MNWHRIRNLTLFILGLAGIVHETAITPDAEPQLLILFAAMIGLPVVLRADERK